MSVAAWGYGTGATTDDAHPFTLTIQGIDVIGAVPIESISSNQSVSGNATLSFSIYDAAGTMALPEGWADVVFSEHTGGQVTTGAFQDELTQDDTFDEGDAVELSPPNYLFGGLVMGMTVRLDAEPARWIDVRCVDYGVLLDVTPMPEDFAVPSGEYLDVATACQAIVGASPLGGITAIVVDSAAVGSGTYPDRTGGIGTGGGYLHDAEITGRRSVRSAIERALEVSYPPRQSYSLGVSPLRELTMLWTDEVLRDSPTAITQLVTTGDGHQVDVDYRPVESAVYVDDTSEPEALAFPGWYWSTINGYTLGTSTVEADRSWLNSIAAPSTIADIGKTYIATRHSGTWTGVVTVTSEYTFMIYSNLTLQIPQLDIDDSYAITSVETKFLGGLTRRSEIQYGGELGTVARFNRTRFARAGVTT